MFQTKEFRILKTEPILFLTIPLSILFILLLIGLSSSCHAQAPILSTEEPLKLSEHFNSKSFILDYLIEKDATCSLILQKIDKTRVYYLKDKFIKDNIKDAYYEFSERTVIPGIKNH